MKGKRPSGITQAKFAHGPQSRRDVGVGLRRKRVGAKLLPVPPQARHYAIVTYFKHIVASINYLKPIVFTIVDMSIVDTRSPTESLGGLLQEARL